MKKSYLKPESDAWFLFTMYDFFTMDMMGMGEKTPKNIYTRKQGKNPQFGFPPIPPSIKLEADCFPGRKKPETSRTYPR